MHGQQKYEYLILPYLSSCDDKVLNLASQTRCAGIVRTLVQRGRSQQSMGARRNATRTESRRRSVSRSSSVNRRRSIATPIKCSRVQTNTTCGTTILSQAGKLVGATRLHRKLHRADTETFEWKNGHMRAVTLLLNTDDSKYDVVMDPMEALGWANERGYTGIVSAFARDVKTSVQNLVVPFTSSTVYGLDQTVVSGVHVAMTQGCGYR